MKGLSPLLKKSTPYHKEFKPPSKLGATKVSQTVDWVDIEWLKRIYNMRKITDMLTAQGYDIATLGSDPDNPNRVFKRKTDIPSISGTVRPTRIHT